LADAEVTKESWLKSLDRYWFDRRSATSLGLFRITMSSLIFVNLCMILIDFDAWFSERGFVPQAIGQRYQSSIPVTGRFLWFPYDLHFSVPRINFLYGVTDDRITLGFYLLLMVATLLCALGFWTRLSSIIMALGIVTLHHRNGLILHGGDTVMRVSALYIAIAPSGAACSMDRIIALFKGKQTRDPVLVSIWPQRLLAYNTALIYFTTFWHKFGFGSHWRDMTATWYPARLHEFDRFPLPGFVNQLPMVYVTTFGTLAVELALGTLVFYRPLRKWVLLAGVGMHAYIDYAMNIPLFSFLMVALYLSFYDGEEIETWARRLGLRLSRYNAIVLLPERTVLKPASEAAIGAMDPLGLVEYKRGDAPTWKAFAKGKPANPFRASLARSIGAWPLAAVPTLWKRILKNSLMTDTSDVEPQPRRKAKIKR
jgi:hypothetical protein